MAISRLMQLLGEVETAFATENAVAPSLDIRAAEITLTREQQTHERAEHQYRVTQHAGHILGRRSGTIGWKQYVVGDGTPLNAAAVAADDTLQTLLETALGGTRSAAGSTVEAAPAPSTTGFTVAAGHGARFAAGQAIAVELSTGYSVSVVAAVAVDALTLEWALPSAPSAGAVVLNGYTAYVDPASDQTMQFSVVGDDDADEWLALGCVGPVALENLLGLDTPPMFSFQWPVTRWETDALAFTMPSFDGAAPVPTTDEVEILYGTHGTSTRSCLTLSALEADLGLTWEPLYARGCSDVEHVARVTLTGARPTVTITPDVAAGFLTDYTAQTLKRLTYIYGTTPGSIVVVDFPRMRISAPPARAEHASQIAATVTLIADEDDADATTAHGRSPVRITRL